MNKLANETANAGTALLALLKGVVDECPELAQAMEGGVRIAFDTYERILTICPIDARGRSQVLLAIPCDPTDRESFGSICAPVPVRGMYDPEKAWH